jgi:endonuclease-3
VEGAVTVWHPARVRDLVGRLERFRAGCRVTTLAEVQHATRSPFHLLVSCVISLRTKDDVTHAASARLFSRADSARDLARLDEATIAGAIYPAGFYRTKARQLRAIAMELTARHDGKVPDTLDQLLALPGVGRKTANLVLGLGFGVPAICVDTHVHRISNRLGLVSSSTPRATEDQLATALPRDVWIGINDLLVTFGQNRCHPVSPRCTGCPLDDLCPRTDVSQHR